MPWFRGEGFPSIYMVLANYSCMYQRTPTESQGRTFEGAPDTDAVLGSRGLLRALPYERVMSGL
jgi:hypothetical protein